MPTPAPRDAPDGASTPAPPERRSDRGPADREPVVELDLPTVAELIRVKRARLQRFASLSRAPRSVRGQLTSVAWRAMSHDQRAEHIATLAVDRMLDAVDEVRDRRALRR